MSNTATQSWTPPTAAPAKADSQKIRFRAKVEWAFLNRKNTMSNKYQIDLTNISEQAATLLSEAGIKVKHKTEQPDKGLYIVPTSQNPIRLYDEAGNEVLEAIGNGSEVIATIEPYAWGPNQYGQGISPSIKKLVLTSLVEFVPESDDDAELPVY